MKKLSQKTDFGNYISEKISPNLANGVVRVSPNKTFLLYFIDLRKLTPS